MLRYLLFGVERRSSKVQLVFVWNTDATSPDSSPPKIALLLLVKNLLSTNSDNKSVSGERSLQSLQIAKNNSIFHSVWAHFHQPSVHNNAITGREQHSWRLLVGPDAVIEQLEVGWMDGKQEETSACGSESCDRKRRKTVGAASPAPSLRFPPMVFRQANIDGFSHIIREIRRWIIPGSDCVELYGGVGTIGLNCLDLPHRLRCSDENPYNKRCFDATLSDLPAAVRVRAQYQSASASVVVASGELDICDLVIVDPPRKGLDEKVLTALCCCSDLSTDTGSGMGRQRLVYVSCGFKAFERDAQTLLWTSRWRLLHASGYVLFPGANHIETLAVFERC